MFKLNVKSCSLIVTQLANSCATVDACYRACPISSSFVVERPAAEGPNLDGPATGGARSSISIVRADAVL